MLCNPLLYKEIFKTFRFNWVCRGFNSLTYVLQKVWANRGQKSSGIQDRGKDVYMIRCDES